MFTINKYQQVLFYYLDGVCLLIAGEVIILVNLQIGFFPREKAFSLRYQTAGMLETVLRAGVLGEDDTGEESPK